MEKPTTFVPEQLKNKENTMEDAIHRSYYFSPNHPSDIVILWRSERRPGRIIYGAKIIALGMNSEESILLDPPYTDIVTSKDEAEEGLRKWAEGGEIIALDGMGSYPLYHDPIKNTYHTEQDEAHTEKLTLQELPAEAKLMYTAQNLVERWAESTLEQTAYKPEKSYALLPEQGVSIEVYREGDVYRAWLFVADDPQSQYFKTGQFVTSVTDTPQKWRYLGSADDISTLEQSIQEMYPDSRPLQDLGELTLYATSDGQSVHVRKTAKYSEPILARDVDRNAVVTRPSYHIFHSVWGDVFIRMV